MLDPHFAKPAYVGVLRYNFLLEVCLGAADRGEVEARRAARRFEALRCEGAAAGQAGRLALRLPLRRGSGGLSTATGAATGAGVTSSRACTSPVVCGGD